MEHGRPLRRVWLRVLVVIFIALVSLVIGFHQVSRVRMARAQARLDKAIDDLHAAGVPRNPDDVFGPRLVPEKNGAIVFKKAVAALSKPAGKEELAVLGLRGSVAPAHLSDPLDPLVEAWRARNTTALELLGRALLVPEWRFDPRPGLVPSTGISLREMSLASALLVADARQAEGRADFAGTARDVEQLLALASVCERDREISARMIALTVREQALGELRRLLALDPSAVGVLGAVEKALADVHSAATLLEAVRGECCLRLAEAEAVRRGHIPVMSQNGKMSWTDRFLYKHLEWMPTGDLADLARLMEREVRIAALPYSEARDAWQQYRDDLTEPMPLYPICLVLLPFPRRAQDAAEEEEAQVSLARAAIVAARLRVERGAWPTDLGGLLPEGVIDPYTGEGLRYAVKGDSARLWIVVPKESLAGTPRNPDIEVLLFPLGDQAPFEVAPK